MAIRAIDTTAMGFGQGDILDDLLQRRPQSGRHEVQAWSHCGEAPTAFRNNEISARIFSSSHRSRLPKTTALQRHLQNSPKVHLRPNSIGSALSTALAIEAIIAESSLGAADSTSSSGQDCAAPRKAPVVNEAQPSALRNVVLIHPLLTAFVCDCFLSWQRLVNQTVVVKLLRSRRSGLCSAGLSCMHGQTHECNSMFLQKGFLRWHHLTRTFKSQHVLRSCRTDMVITAISLYERRERHAQMKHFLQCWRAVTSAALLQQHIDNLLEVCTSAGNTLETKKTVNACRLPRGEICSASNQSSPVEVALHMTPVVMATTMVQQQRLIYLAMFFHTWRRDARDSVFLSATSTVENEVVQLREEIHRIGYDALRAQTDSTAMRRELVRRDAEEFEKLHDLENDLKLVRIHLDNTWASAADRVDVSCIKDSAADRLDVTLIAQSDESTQVDLSRLSWLEGELSKLRKDLNTTWSTAATKDASGNSGGGCMILREKEDLVRIASSTLDFERLLLHAWREVAELRMQCKMLAAEGATAAQRDCCGSILAAWQLAVVCRQLLLETAAAVIFAGRLGSAWRWIAFGAWISVCQAHCCNGHNHSLQVAPVRRPDDSGGELGTLSLFAAATTCSPLCSPVGSSNHANSPAATSGTFGSAAPPWGSLAEHF